MNPIRSVLCILSISAISLTVHADKAPAILVVQTEGAEIGQWTMDFDAAKKIAAEKKLPLLLNFTGSDWCGWCKIMDKNVFSQDVWEDFAAENAVLVTIDFPKNKSTVPEKFVERNNNLKSQFGVGGSPTYVILDSDGETKIGQLGAGKDKTPESFISEFKTIVQFSASSIEAFVIANPDKAEAYKAAIETVKNAQKTLADWLETKPARNDENIKKLGELQNVIKNAQQEVSKF